MIVGSKADTKYTWQMRHFLKLRDKKQKAIRSGWNHPYSKSYWTPEYVLEPSINWQTFINPIFKIKNISLKQVVGIYLVGLSSLTLANQRSTTHLSERRPNRQQQLQRHSLFENADGCGQLLIRLLSATWQFRQGKGLVASASRWSNIIGDGWSWLLREKGQAKILKRGDVIKCPANTPHWHSAKLLTIILCKVAVTNRHFGWNNLAARQ